MSLKPSVLFNTNHKDKRFFQQLTVKLTIVVMLLGVLRLFSGCNSSSKIQQPQVRVTSRNDISDSLVRKQSLGTDFYASGNIPFSWSINMDVDKDFLFTSGATIATVPAVQPLAFSSVELTIYHSSTTQGEMEIMIYNELCKNGEQSKKVEVKFNNTLYTGCGRYLYNPQLNGSWVLERVGNLPLAASEFPKGLPIFTFSISNNVFSGTDGCGSLSGNIALLGSRIKFSVMSFSKGLCKNVMVRNIVKDKLSEHTADYYFKEDKLILYLIDDSQLTLRKAN